MKYLFLHGLGQTAASWNRVLETLPAGMDTACPELSGLFGDGPCRYDKLYSALASRCDGIPGPVSLCGLSLGGILAMQYAMERPEKVRSLVLIGTQYTMPRRLLRVQNMMFRLMPKRSFAQTGFQKQDLIHLCSSMLDLDLREGLEKITCPTLVVCGQRDRANKPAAKELETRLPAAELRVVEGAGHELNTEAPEALGDLLRWFWMS